MSQQETNAAEVLLARLADHQVDYLFCNAGTDFPSIIEGLAKAAGGAGRAPVPIAVPHENLAVAMAHGYTQATGRPQAVMLHVNVGTANAVCGLLNAGRDCIPMLVFAGRTPVDEAQGFGARSVFIHWGQEMFDQAGMVREAVKWDYELRSPAMTAQVVDRAVSLAMSAPRRPTYVTLPREVLAQPAPLPDLPVSRSVAATPAAAAPESLEMLADWLMAADCPLLITAGYGRNETDWSALDGFARTTSVPVVAYRPRYMALASDHPMNLGFEPAAPLQAADLVLVVECDVPWVPKLHQPKTDAKVVHIGPDPLFGDYVMRGYPADLAVTGDAAHVLAQLDRLIATRGGRKTTQSQQTLIDQFADRRSTARAGAKEKGPPGPHCDPAWLAHCLNQAKKADDIIVVETGLPLDLLDYPQPGCHFGVSPAGGLGWGLGAAIGHKLARPDRRVIAVVGDGAYMFGNPTPAHFICEALGLPVLTIILNNSMWGAVRRATLSLYPDGAAARSNDAPLTHLKPSPRFECVVAASGGFGEQVSDAGDLPAALARALHAVDVEGRQAVLNVLCDYSDGDALRDSKR